MEEANKAERPQSVNPVHIKSNIDSAKPKPGHNSKDPLEFQHEGKYQKPQTCQREIGTRPVKLPAEYVSKGTDLSADSLPSYMRTKLIRVMGDAGDRRGRVNFLIFINKLSIDDLKFLSKKVGLPISFTQYGAGELELLRATIIHKMMRRDLSLNDILQKLENTSSHAELIAQNLRKELAINHQHVTEAVKKQFSKTIGMSEKDKSMVIKIYNLLSRGQTFQIALLLLTKHIDLVEDKSKNFIMLYKNSLFRDKATVKDLVEALVDSGLFDGDVKRAITNCYGNSFESAEYRAMPCDSEKETGTRQVNMYGCIRSKLTCSEDRGARIKLISCIKMCSDNDLVAMSFYFDFPPKETDLIARNGYSEMLINLFNRSITFENLLNFFKCDQEKYSCMTRILEGDESIDEDSLIPDNLKRVNLDKELTDELKVLMMAKRIDDELNHGDKKILAYMLIKNTANSRNLGADSFCHTLNYLLTQCALLKELVAALHDLGLEEPLKIVAKFLGSK